MPKVTHIYNSLFYKAIYFPLLWLEEVEENRCAVLAYYGTVIARQKNKYLVKKQRLTLQRV